MGPGGTLALHSFFNAAVLHLQIVASDLIQACPIHYLCIPPFGGLAEGSLTVDDPHPARRAHQSACKGWVMLVKLQQFWLVWAPDSAPNGMKPTFHPKYELPLPAEASNLFIGPIYVS